MNNETLIKLIKNSKILDITFNVLKEYEGWSVETKSTGNQHRTTLSRGINKIYIILLQMITIRLKDFELGIWFGCHIL